MEDSYQVRTCTSLLPSLVPRISSSLTLHGYKVVLTSWSLPCRCFIAYAASDQTMMFRTSLAGHTLHRERKGVACETSSGHQLLDFSSSPSNVFPKIIPETTTHLIFNNWSPKHFLVTMLGVY